MDQEYDGAFPDEIVEVREDLEEEKKRINEERRKMEKVESIYTAFDSIGGVSVARLNPGAVNNRNPRDIRLIKIEAVCTSLDKEPVEKLLKMGGTAEWNEEGYYEIVHKVEFEVK